MKITNSPAGCYSFQDFAIGILASTGAFFLLLVFAEWLAGLVYGQFGQTSGFGAIATMVITTITQVLNDPDDE